MTLGQLVTNFTGQVVHARARARARVCVSVCALVYVCTCYKTIVVYTIHHRKLCTRMFILKENV